MKHRMRVRAEGTGVMDDAAGELAVEVVWFGDRYHVAIDCRDGDRLLLSLDEARAVLRQLPAAISEMEKIQEVYDDDD